MVMACPPQHIAYRTSWLHLDAPRILLEPWGVQLTLDTFCQPKSWALRFPSHCRVAFLLATFRPQKLWMCLMLFNWTCEELAR